MKNYGKIFKWLMLALIVVSVAILVWGFMTGFETNNGQAVDVLFYWAYAMLAVALCAVIIVGIIISAANNPKSIIKGLIAIVAIAAVCFVVYLVSPGSPAQGLVSAEPPTASTLKLTDTILNLTYLTGGLAILSIIVGEVIAAVRNKK